MLLRLGGHTAPFKVSIRNSACSFQLIFFLATAMKLFVGTDKVKVAFLATLACFAAVKL